MISLQALSRPVIVLIPLCASSVATAQKSPLPSPHELLEAMERASITRNYTGVFVYQRGAQMDSMRIVHKGDGGSEFERLLSLTGPAREVIRDGTRVTCVFPDEKSVIVEPSQSRQYLQVALSDPLHMVEQYYRFAVEGADRVAGRPTWVVSIQPRETDRYGYVLSIDQAEHLPLQSRVIEARGNALEEIQFTQIEFLDEIPAEMLEPHFSKAGYTWYTSPTAEHAKATVPVTATALVESSVTAQEPQTEEPPWRADWLPAGFRMLEMKRQTITGRRPVSHAVYSDGLAMVSIFVERLTDIDQPLRGVSSLGAVTAIGRVSNDYQITVVGEIPLATAKRIAASVAFEAE